MAFSRPSFRLLLAAMLCCGSLLASHARAAEVDFAHDVIPLLQKHCASCHSNGTYKGSMSIDTREALLETGVVEPGDSSASYLIDLVTSDDPKMQMPPKGERLTADEVDTLRRWIDADLPWEAGYSFKAETYQAPLKPRRPELPAAEPDIDNPLDQIIFHYWKEHGVKPPTPEWGQMLSTARGFLPDYWWTAIFPGAAIFLAVLSFNLLGDGLRDVLDPKSRR